ncbi:serine/threonine-protein kinase/endoribonuclease IRE2-like [Clupea harengus]|uniref:Serine/threonine-protein kinase/endoribonuclease IRE2-like n=1 Tax=Clupea harengus TaxID=7950 RepID=A0A8M1KL08_CLUHA|nr:serine/threonine-protein kinase/endoribonuclease IRE2-like [Clupea harengus]
MAVLPIFDQFKLTSCILERACAHASLCGSSPCYSAKLQLYKVAENMEDSSLMFGLLDDLSELELKRFKAHLSEDTLKGFARIPRGKLEKADVTDTVGLMKNCYGRGCMEMTQHILKTMGRRDPTEQFEQNSQDSSTGSTNQTVSGAGTGLTRDVHTLGLESTEEVNRLPSVATPSAPMASTTPTNRRNWIPCSKRWRKELEELANMEESKVMRVGGLTFVFDEERFQIALSGQTEVLLGLRDDGTEVAIKKMLKPNFKKLKQELEVLRKHRFNSLHVVQYLDFTSDSYCGHIAIQLCEFNLEEYIQKQKQPEDSERKRIAREFLEGLKDLHEKSMIHRDIKPRNVFIDIEGRVRLADFGISRILDPGQTTQVTDRAGTKYWEATEIIKPGQPGDQRRYKRSTDIQVAGMLVYYILSGGRHPFEDDLNCQAKISKGDYNLKHLKDVEAKDLVESMINDDPEKRPRITEVLKHPYFWEEDRKEMFLGALGNVREVEKYKDFSNDENLAEKKQGEKKQGEKEEKSFSTWKTQVSTHAHAHAQTDTYTHRFAFIHLVDVLMY